MIQPDVAPRSARQVIEDAAWKLLGTARDMPGDVGALAYGMHDNRCDCGGGPDDDDWKFASELVQRGWRRSGTAAVQLSALLDEIAKAWGSAGANLPGGQQRWKSVCVLAARIAQEITR